MPACESRHYFFLLIQKFDIISRKKIKMIKNLFFLFKKNNAVLPALFGLIGVDLIIVGFFVPPMGMIDSSVLQGSGIIFAFTTLFKIESIIESVAEGRSLILKHGQTEIQIKDNDDENK